MVTTKKALIYSTISALIIGAVHYIAHQTFNNPALMASNIKAVGITVVIAVFLVSFIGMKRNGRRK